MSVIYEQDFELEQRVQIAKQLGYPKIAINDMRRCKNIIDVENIMHDARLEIGKYKPNQKGGFMFGKALTSREADKILRKNGFHVERITGDHLIYKNNSNESLVITVGKAFSQKTWKRECKRLNIKY